MYLDEVAEEIERRAMRELDRQYRPDQSAASVAWKKAIVDVLADKSRLLRMVPASKKIRVGKRIG